MKKVLFLDFDGVLNSFSFMEREVLTHVRGILDDLAVDRLNRIVEATDCDIVVSSTWRLFEEHDTPEALGSVLESFGFKYKDRVIDKTRELRVSSRFKSMPADRGLEIQDWLNWNKCDRFAILEDAENMGHLEPVTFRTTWEEGLDDSIADSVIAHLNVDLV